MQKNMLMKGIALGVMIFFISSSFVSGINVNQNEMPDVCIRYQNYVDDEVNGVNPIAVIDTSMGAIKVELYQDLVPNTVENFIKLANDGFYDGLVFHRVIDDFMIQGGGFETDGSKKESPYGTIDLEINEEVRHVDGAIAMARTSDPNSATSQFYICDGSQSFLDDQYAAFGVTIEGIDVVREIAALDPEHTTTKYGMQNWPEDDVIINSIIII